MVLFGVLFSWFLSSEISERVFNFVSSDVLSELSCNKQTSGRGEISGFESPQSACREFRKNSFGVITVSAEVVSISSFVDPQRVTYEFLMKKGTSRALAMDGPNPEVKLEDWGNWKHSSSLPIYFRPNLDHKLNY